MKSGGDSHVARLLREGESLLSEGRGGEASFRFSRVLLDDPGHDQARAGEARARALLEEDERLAELHLDDAREALRLGRKGEAHSSLAEAVQRGADPDLVQPLVDRLDEREGLLAVAPGTGRSSSRGPASAHWAFGLPRTVLALCFSLVLAVLLAAVTARWEHILGRLTRAPRPSAGDVAPLTTLAPPSAGESALQEARQHLATGEARQAMRVLDRIPEQDPNWPYARRLRAEAESALARTEALP